MNRRLEKLRETLGKRGRSAYAPQLVMSMVHTRHWRGAEIPADDDGASGTPAQPHDRRMVEAARQATTHQIVAWVTADARRHDWQQPYSLILDWPDDSTTVAHFHLPWRKPVAGPVQQALASLTGHGALRWPDVANTSSK